MNRRGQNGLGELPEDHFRQETGIVGYGKVGGNFDNEMGMSNRLVILTGVAVRVLPDNKRRKYLIFVNTGVETVFMSFGSSAPVSGSIPIPPGGNYEPWHAPNTSVYARVGAGLAGSLVVVEGLITA